MYQLTPFSQDHLLRDAGVDPAARRGVCVGLCDWWLRDVVQRPDAPALGRLRQLEREIEKIVQHQQRYSHLFRLNGSDARLEVARQVGLDYAEQTLVMRKYVGLDGIRRKLANDLRHPGAAATWGLQFAGGLGHAIAGFCGLTGRAPLMRYELHVFDPNIGEYIGDYHERTEILDDLFTRLPIYRTVVAVERVFGAR